MIWICKNLNLDETHSKKQLKQRLSEKTTFPEAINLP